jgi:hypothetical protein
MSVEILVCGCLLIASFDRMEWVPWILVALSEGPVVVTERLLVVGYGFKGAVAGPASLDTASWDFLSVNPPISAGHYGDCLYARVLSFVGCVWPG